jgi:hypothetical protein
MNKIGKWSKRTIRDIMLISVKLLSGEVLPYTLRGVRGNRCKIATHAPHIQSLVLSRLALSPETHFVKLITEEDVKEMEQVYYSRYVFCKSEYYENGLEILAFVESFEAQQETFFISCEELLSKASALYASLGEKERSLTENQVYEMDEFSHLYPVYTVKNELETAIWGMSHALGIPLTIGECDPQENTVRTLVKEPSIFILFYTRSIERCETFLKNCKPSSSG